MSNQVNQEALIANEFNKQYPYDDMNGWDRKLFKSGYQAATQASESEINTLKQRVEESSELLKDRQSDLDFEFNRAEQNELMCNELQADKTRLLEALQSARNSFIDIQELNPNENIRGLSAIEQTNIEHCLTEVMENE